MAKHGHRPCTVCTHPHVRKIDEMLVLRSNTQQQIADRFGLHYDAIRRHLSNHVAEEKRREIVLAHAVADKQSVADALNSERIEVDTGLRRIVREIDALLQRAKSNGDDPMALMSLREMRATLMDLAKLHGNLKQELTVQVNLNESPQFLTLREMILRVLERHPDARSDFLTEMRRLQVGYG